MNVHPRSCVFYRPQYVPIVVRGQIPRQATLNTNFCGADGPSFFRLACHLIQSKKIRVVLARPAAECAELAAYKTNIGEVDVAVYDIRDDIACEFAAQRIGGDQQPKQIVALRICQQQALFMT